MRTDGYTGPFVARPAKTGGAADVIRKRDPDSYESIQILRVEDLSDLGGPTAMELASLIATDLEKWLIEAGMEDWQRSST